MLILLAGCLSLASAQILQDGRCDTIDLQNDFEVEKFTGRWYSLRGNSILQNGDCSYINILPKDSDNQYTVHGSYVEANARKEISGTAVASDASPTFNLTLEGTTMDFKVISTDYDNFALMYSCENVGDEQRSVYIWQLARDTSFSDETINSIVEETIFSNFGLETTDLSITSHSDAVCNVATREPVILAGQCDQSIPVESNLNLTRFSGEWRLISSYYNERQSGECNHAIYTVQENGLAIENRHVVNRQLLTTSGTAVFASNEQNGKLRVTVGSNTRDYWILETDYESYALAYSCENLPNNQQRIYSWQLSRTNTLTDQAIINIETRINNTAVLDSDLYIDAIQSSAACFYYPSLLPNEPVILPGTCNANVPVEPNFQLARFSGEWRLISSYYNERQTGECNHAIYTVQGNSLTVQNRHVLDQTLLTVSGTITFASNETNGKLVATVGSNTRDFWILGTDYDNYALAYSCENIANNQQRIFSWKLSRRNTLSPEANSIITAIINRVDALYEPYFTNAYHSNSACFYYPDISSNEPVIFQGVCDQNIIAENNFNLQRFTGEWRLISTYYNERQSGQCNRARYTQEGDRFTVVNSNVVNGALETVTGVVTFASDTVRDGKLVVTIGSRSSDYWILATDYNSYALAYSCENLNKNRYRVKSWKLSRTNTLSVEANQNINKVFERVPTLNDRYFSDVDRSNRACFYMPEVDPSKPVVFRGQCDQSISVIRDFDVDRYMGQWYDIESYPSTFQYGTCNSAFYSRRGNFVDVVNTQVVNQTISVRQAVGTFVENERTAKLSLNFGSTPRDYWVLATDYNTFAFVYSCLNIDSENMQVAAWKLSKTRQLSQSAQTAINNVMANINVLDTRYFIERDHTSAGCTFNENILPGDPVYLEGNCPTNISPVANFNITRFAGVWYDIESYPIDLWSRQCSLQEFVFVGTNRLGFTSRTVRNQELVEVRGTATRISGNGQLTITIETDLRTHDVPFTVLAVDYEDYALAYGCVQMTPNLRRVYSWKLSRTRELSNNANIGINAIILANPDLINRFYADGDYSDSACFFLPDISLDEAVIFPGQCDKNIRGVPTFNVESFLGRWRLISSYYSHRQSGECNQMDYSREGTTLRVTNMHVENSELKTVSGSAIAAADGSGKLSVSISRRTVDFLILATDYDSYALAYSCSDLNANQKRVYSWKLSRTTSLNETAETAINNVVNQIDVLNERYYALTDNSENACFYYPTVDPSQPVIFVGQCDPNIPVERNFQTNLYLGEWYDVESYPSSFQYGTCNTARYSASGNNILVNNTQIVDGVVSVREAVGVFPEGNTVGKLRLNFGSNDRDYWILSTDYSSYALVYSCINLDANRKQVGTWKLSRTRTLSQSAQNAINSTMSTIRELDQRFFITRNHTDAGCFYHRDQSPNSVIFSGRCDSAIPAMANFNLTAFQGVWHEIETYPSEMISGECLSQEYSERTGSSLNLVQRNVRLERQFEVNGVATLATNDNSGKLSLAIQGATIPFWILNTDYADYAFAYGCVDLANNERQVYSWKLSRHQQLSAAARREIETVKATIPVLDSRYYKNIDQSDKACFHLPDFAPGESVILPGQCDVDIPVVRNFDAQRYSGVWYQIEKYFQRFETGGNCTGARYTHNSETGVVTVLNWQVVNGALDTIEGTARVTSTDGSAKLTVRLPIRSSDPNNPEFRETSLYVLTTDYTSYSLAYSCVNLDGNRRQVGAWKLSRARTMSNAGNSAINDYMRDRQELQDAYFVAVSQSDSCPEPSSGTLIKSSIIMLITLCVSLVYLS